MRFLTSYCLVILSSCAPEVGEQGDGRLMLSTSFSGVKTRAGEPAEYTVKIGNQRGYTHLFDQSSVPSELWIANGSYFIEVEAGESFTEPTWDERDNYYKTRQDFSITTGQTNALNVVCKPLNSSLAIRFGENVTKYLQDYKVELTIPGASAPVAFDAANAGETLSLMFAGEATDINWKFTAFHDDINLDVEKTGTLQDLAQGKAYSLTFDYSYTELRGVFDFNITVDKTTNDSSNEIIIYQRPRITGVDPYGATAPIGGHKLTVVAAVGNIGALRFSGAAFGGDLDVLTGDIANYGITLAPITAGYEVTLGQAFFDRVIEVMGVSAAQTAITITATDDTPQARTSETEFRIGSAGIRQITRGDMWATRVDVSGMSYLAGDLKLAYRSMGGAWNYLDVNSGSFDTEITGLAPQTQYEVCVMRDGTQVGSMQTFTTEVATPLYNGGFEEWNQYDDVWYANQSGTSFWDSGNKGSVKAPVIGSANNNNNTRNSSTRPGSTGSYCANIDSQWFGMMGMGAFAAGSLYTGEFIEARADASNPSGRLNFGRPFTGRPRAMSVWYRAYSGSVDYAKSGAPLSNGQTDKWGIYIALVDGNFPREVDTANWSNFVDYTTDPDVIAYGHLSGSANPEIGWTNDVIELEYRSYDRIPTHIVVVASSSMYGDYFTGSTGSWMQVDDFELIY